MRFHKKDHVKSEEIGDMMKVENINLYEKLKRPVEMVWSYEATRTRTFGKKG